MMGFKRHIKHKEKVRRDRVPDLFCYLAQESEDWDAPDIFLKDIFVYGCMNRGNYL